MLKIILIFIFIINYVYAYKIIKIDLSNQRLYAVENGEVIFSGQISSGKRGHRTPKGNFKILDKERFHISNKYPKPNGGAKMPYMLRLTNSGLAIHKGYMPGYPASHGCIRVGSLTAKKLWYWANIGTRVKIYGNAGDYTLKRKKVYYKRNYVKRKHRRYHRRYYRRYNKRRYARRGRKFKRYYKRYRKKYAKRNNDGYEIIEIFDE